MKETYKLNDWPCKLIAYGDIYLLVERREFVIARINDLDGRKPKIFSDKESGIEWLQDHEMDFVKIVER